MRLSDLIGKPVTAVSGSVDDPPVIRITVGDVVVRIEAVGAGSYLTVESESGDDWQTTGTTVIGVP